ncbi:MAG: TRAP transporter substrate-binding protein, partial [Candidatus Bathyarchaeota archaeon]|nr:TRAP transporter substrate-binding protein [Candidatus Bathyarchaeum sp.]
KLRVPTNEIYVRMFQAFGPATVMMPMGEIYNALETKVVDGQDNPYPTVQTTGWWEVQKYMLESRHMFVANPWLVNKNFHDQMPENLRKIFDDNVKKAIDYNWKISEEADASAKKFLEDKGIVVNVPSPEFRQQMKDSLKDFYSWYFETIPGAKDIVPAMEKLPK